MQLSDSITTIKGIGEKTAELYYKLGIFTLADIIEYYPKNYEVYGEIIPINEVEEDKVQVIQACVCKSVQVKKIKNLQLITCVVYDKTGELGLTWFNMPFLKNHLRLGIHFLFRGKVVKKQNELIMQQPILLSEEEYYSKKGILQPVYPLTAGISNNAILKAVSIILKELPITKDYLPENIRIKHQLVSDRDAIQEIHFPKNRKCMIEARKRIVFDEFFLFSLALKRLKEVKLVEPNHYQIKEDNCEEIIHSLPYTLTKAQYQVLQEIKQDLKKETIMNRLIQGDVGSGKTVIAILALFLVIQQGFQGAFMVPTEVLAKQHYESVTSLLSQYYIKIELLVGSMTAKEKREAYKRIETHQVDIIIGTHALIQEKVKYSKLALVITDEQHRFGVKQREELFQKGNKPHTLVMSATPIPRTLAIILYGDLDISIIDELPANRLQVKNCIVDTTYRNTAYQFIEKEVQKGHQAYIICPMVEESQTLEVENVIEYTEKLKEKLDHSILIQYLHGKMKPREKNDIMTQFANGTIKVLVSTTVIEVGVNVPNATIMMIENAERFGLAQLHQLRGRVGRGNAQAYCILVSGKKGKETKERLEILNQSNDGFFIANKDLKLRGGGDLFGIRQSGELEFKMGDIFADAILLKEASDAVSQLTKIELDELCKKYQKVQSKIGRYTGII